VKGYRQFCAVARALDVLGDRWALLVVRELLLGPRRYTDLLTGLPGVPSSVLTTRLRALEHSNVVRRTELPPPAAATVYELTGDGAALGPILDDLARWGARLMDRPEPGDATRACWLTYSLAVSVPASVLPANAALELRLNHDVNTLQRRGGRLEAHRGAAANPLAVVESSIRAMRLIAAGESHRAQLQAQGKLTISGDTRIAESFLDAAHAVWRSPTPPPSA
jgi:DNA-binding HxlR family transcriptional regulator